MTGVVSALLLGVGSAWLRFDWGPLWAEELGRRWEQWSFENLPDFKWRRSPSDEQTTHAEPVALTPSPDQTPSTKQSPVPAKPVAAPIPSAIDPLEYDAGSKLDGAQGGKGWASAWKATDVSIARSDDGKYVFASFGGGLDSSAQREAGSFGKFLLKGSTNLYFTAYHPGPDAPPLRVNLMGITDGKSEAPLMINPEGDKLRISIEGSSEIMEAPAGKTLRIAMRWDFKKQRNGRFDVEIRAFLNPNPKSRSPLSGCPTSRRVLKNVKPPASLVVMLQAHGGSRPVTLGDVNIGGQIQDLLK